jgi:hypothetical protein
MDLQGSSRGQIKILSPNLLGATGKNHEKPKSG